jgi:hypothetical protein
MVPIILTLSIPLPSLSQPLAQAFVKQFLVTLYIDLRINFLNTMFPIAHIQLIGLDFRQQIKRKLPL